MRQQMPALPYQPGGGGTTAFAATGVRRGPARPRKLPPVPRPERELSRA